ncbi:MAG: ATP synthase F1 subunit gamma [Candidatus Pacebacteria bacterium]|nr:ATP synthase F1 subunit gamma [Candidatus Paceibacterota bacterium]
MQTKTIKQKMKSVQNIGKITKAMEMISVSKMKKSVEKRLASKVFADRSFELLENLHVHKNLSHPYLESREGNKVLMVIIASNKGLCGGYNMNVSKQVTAFKKSHPDHTIDAIAVGKQSEKIARRNGLTILASFNELSDYYTGSEVRSVLNTVLESYDNDEAYAEVVIAYTEFVSSLSFDAKITPFIPLKVDTAAKLARIEESTNSKRKFALYNFEPNEQAVLDSAVPAVLMTVIYQLLLESLASEHSARVMAMRNASDNAAEMYDDLKLNYNRARQAAITQEISEIVGGSAAVS